MPANMPALQQFEQFIFKEVRYIDERRWDDWLALFDEDGDYWIPLSAEDNNPRESLSIAYEDRAKLLLRCQRYTHPQFHAQLPASHTSHIVSNIMLDGIEDGTEYYLLYAQFAVREYRLKQCVDWAGTFHYKLRQDGDTFKIKRKKVLLVDSESELETIHVPF